MGDINDAILFEMITSHDYIKFKIVSHLTMFIASGLGGRGNLFLSDDENDVRTNFTFDAKKNQYITYDSMILCIMNNGRSSSSMYPLDTYEDDGSTNLPENLSNLGVLSVPDDLKVAGLQLSS